MRLRRSDVGFNLGNFFNSIGTTAGHAIGVLPKNKHITGVDWKGIDRTVNSIGDAVKKIPVVGPLFHGVLGAAAEPFALSESILKGERVDHAFVDSFKRQIGQVREVAPYAQAVISFIPGVGTAASMAIGAGLAIAAGRPIDEVAVAAVSSALPGGSLAAAAYNTSRTAIVNHKVSGLGTLVSAIGAAAGVDVPPAASAAIVGGLDATQAIANGQKPDQALLTAALKAVPAAAKDVDLSTQTGVLKAADTLLAQGQKMIPKLSSMQRTQLQNALNTGLAMGHAQNLQKLQKAAIGVGTQKLAQIGQRTTNAVATAARSALQGAGTHGFDVGHGLAQHQTTPSQAATTRAALSPEDQHGFDVASTLHIGRVIAKPAPPKMPAAAQAARAIVHGAQAAPPTVAAAVKQTMTTTAVGQSGAAVAEKEIAEAARAVGWLDAALVGGGLAIGGAFGGAPWAFLGAVLGGGADMIRRQLSNPKPTGK